MEIFAPPPKFHPGRETALGHLEMGLLPAAESVCAFRPAGGAVRAAALRASSPSFCLPPVSRSRAEGLLWRVFPPHFVASSLSHPTVSYTVDGLTRNTFLKACVREYNCSNECMFDRFINF